LTYTCLLFVLSCTSTNTADIDNCDNSVATTNDDNKCYVPNRYEIIPIHGFRHVQITYGGKVYAITDYYDNSENKNGNGNVKIFIWKTKHFNKLCNKICAIEGKNAETYKDCKGSKIIVNTIYSRLYSTIELSGKYSKLLRESEYNKLLGINRDVIVIGVM